MRELVKICKNGTKIYKSSCTCDRCNGRGWYAVGVRNGELIPTTVDRAICYKCGGSGKMTLTEREFTEEHKRELEEKAEKKRAKAERRAEEYRKHLEEEEERRKAEELARYESHKYIGSIGDKIEAKVTYLYTGYYDTFYGRTYIHSFEDKDGIRYVWKTSTYLSLEENTEVTIKGTLKEHSEYNKIRQNILTRCKVIQ